MRVAAAAALLYAARRYYRNWGTTKEECAMYLPGDELLDRPVVRTTEAVWINAPANAVWPWLVQMGQDRGGLYSDETLENLVGLELPQRRSNTSRMATARARRSGPAGAKGLDGSSRRLWPSLLPRSSKSRPSCCVQAHRRIPWTPFGHSTLFRTGKIAAGFSCDPGHGGATGPTGWPSNARPRRRRW